MSFESLGLRAELLRAVHEHAYDTPTQVQAFAIPFILEGRDVLVAAETGSGKTASFTLPMLQRLMLQRLTSEGMVPEPPLSSVETESVPELPLPNSGESAPDESGATDELVPQQRPIGNTGSNNRDARPPRALILVPTRELCAQVTENVRAYGRHLPLRCVQIFGGVGMQPQVVALRSGVDIVIATPGRLLDHIQRGSVDLSGMEMLVLDEADRMLDMGFIDVIRRVIGHLPTARQNLLFCAALGDDVQALADSLLVRPEVVAIAPKVRPVESIEQVFYDVEPPHKADALAHLFHDRGWPQALIFTRTKHGADRLAKKLYRAGITSDSIHGNKGQGARTRALTRFKNAEIAALVATDVAARGIDITGLPQVVNFDLPHVAEDYIYRIARTGQPDQPGHAISLVSVEEQRLLQAISRLVGADLQVQPLEGFVPRILPPREPRPPRPDTDAAEAGFDDDLAERDDDTELATTLSDGDAGVNAGQDNDPRGRRTRRRRRGRGRPLDAPRAPTDLLPTGGILEAFVDGDDERQPGALSTESFDDDDGYDDDTQPAWLSQHAAQHDPVDDDDFVDTDDEDNIGNRIIDPPQDFRARSPFAGQDKNRGSRQQRHAGRAPNGGRPSSPAGERRPPGPAGVAPGQAGPRANADARPRGDAPRGRSRRNRRGGPRSELPGNAPNQAFNPELGNGSGAVAPEGEARAPRPPRPEGSGGRRGRQRFRDRPRGPGDAPPADSIGNVAAAPGDTRARSNAGRPQNRNRNGGAQAGAGNRPRRQGRAVEITHGVSRRRFGFPSDWSKNIPTGPKERLDYAPAPLRASSWEGGAPSGDFLRKVDTQRAAPKIIERKKGRRLLSLKRETETPSES